jgi:hypothetical protein
MMLSLTNVTVEGNINLLYYVVYKYSNKEFQCSDDYEENESSDAGNSKPKDVNKRLLAVNIINTTVDESFFVFSESTAISKNFQEQGKEIRDIILFRF